MGNKILDYRESHIEKGKGKVYHESFNIYPFRKYMWEWEKKILANILNKQLRPESSILDFACGTGRILEFLCYKSRNVIGVDISDSMLEICRKNLPNLEIIKADLTRDNIFKGARQFDVITAFRFFLNAQDPLKIEALNALHPLLKEDGIIIFNNHKNTFSLSAFLGRWVLVKNLFRKPDNRFHNYNSLSEIKIKQILKKTGYEILETHHRGVFPIPNEKTTFNVSKIKKLEDWFSSKKLFRLIAVNVIYVCRKKELK